MDPHTRQSRILELLRVLQKEVRVEELAEMFGVSALTIRRDLDTLSLDKAIIRTHGGCLAIGRAALESEYHTKVAVNFELKRAIAARAAREVVSHEVVLLNDGSTTFHVAMQLGARGHCTMYTNSLAMISEYSRFRGVRLFFLGGEYDEEHYSMRGSIAEQALERLRVDTVFLGTDALDEHGRCLVATPEEARLAEIMLRSGRSRVLVADHTKLYASGQVSFATLDDFDLWVTSAGIPESFVSVHEAHTEVAVARPVQ